MGRLAFDKYEGLGNDFIVVDAASEGEVPTERAIALCDRRFGVGGDGVLLVLPASDPRCVARMRVINADGSIPEMCGNGVRCVALHLLSRSGGRALDGAPARQARVSIETDAGPRTCIVDGGPSEATVTVDMGIVRVLGERTFEVDGQRVTLTTADAGNPHAIAFGAFERADVDRLGSRLAVDPAFPRGTNVEFARVGPTGIDLIVWERGVGVTLACGTGACATVAAACAKGLATQGAPVVVRLPGGPLEITIDDDGRATMRGPARHVFHGQEVGRAPIAASPGSAAL